MPSVSAAIYSLLLVFSDETVEIRYLLTL